MTLPEAQLIRQEHILRDMQLTEEVKLAKKSLVRWLALSLGLISPNESRDLMLDVLETLFYFHFKQEEADINRIVERVISLQPKQQKSRKAGEPKLDEKTRFAKAIRYHLLQLKNKGLIDRKNGIYTFVLDPMDESRDLGSAVEFVYESNASFAIQKIKLALQALERSY